MMFGFKHSNEKHICNVSGCVSAPELHFIYFAFQHLFSPCKQFCVFCFCMCFKCIENYLSVCVFESVDASCRDIPSSDASEQR